MGAGLRAGERAAVEGGEAGVQGRRLVSPGESRRPPPLGSLSACSDTSPQPGPGRAPGSQMVCTMITE